MQNTNTAITLSDGKVFLGHAELYDSPVYGEVVFNTGMFGYEEVLTDPSYNGQILVFAYPLLGNYGVNPNANTWESDKIQVNAVICQSVYRGPLMQKNNIHFTEWLSSQLIPIVTGVDTRSLIKTLSTGAQPGVITHSTQKIQTTLNPSSHRFYIDNFISNMPSISGQGKFKIILVDCGCKQNILNCLLKFDVTVKVVPCNYDYSNDSYDGVLLSNGPGDPSDYTTTIKVISKALANNKPMFGICLGCQLLAISVGAKTYKLQRSHRSQNHPCINMMTQICYLTSQNHGYAVDESSLPIDWQVSYRSLHDNSVEGIMHKYKPFTAVQFHPEAASGPHDAVNLFKQFFEQVLLYAN